MKNLLGGVFGTSGAHAITDKTQTSKNKLGNVIYSKFESEIERGLNQYGLKEWTQYEHEQLLNASEDPNNVQPVA